MTLTIDDLIQNLIANNNGKKDELITAIEKSANYGYKVAVDKACDWLYEYNRKQANKMFGTVHTADVTINVAEFRKAMEGGEE